MKKKFSLWLNIATICLCVCAIAIGVYSAQSATLTVTGSVGFEAHNILYTATAEAKNFATDEERVLTGVTKTQATQENNELSLIDMYFSDKLGEVPDIELEITIKNDSKFDIMITPVDEDCTGVDITSTGATSATKQGETATITYTLSLQENDAGVYDNITATANNLTISIKFEKKAITYKTDKSGNQIVVNKFNENDIKTNEPIR